MPMNGSGSRGVGANSFDEDALLTFCFHLINLCLPEAGICRNNQSIADKEEVENTGIGRADKSGIRGADIKKDPGPGGANVVEGPGTGGADKPEDPGIGGADKPSQSKVDREEDIGEADIEKEPGIGGADREEDSGRADI